MKKHIGFIIFLAFIIFLFLGDLIIMKSSFIYGDYSEQFYPWSKIYSESIKELQFPFWTKYFHSGFPLTAEGQTGVFYPLNIILFFFLPFNMAYNYSVILHFILAAVFTYIYARKIGADQWGGTLSAFLFCFGSAYAGCFYNIISVRTLIWFPLVLYFFEKYFDSFPPHPIPLPAGERVKGEGNNSYLVINGIIFGIQLLAGFAQFAIYSGIFYLVYFICGFILSRNLRISEILKLTLLFLIAGIIFYPQFILTRTLVNLSMRSTASLDFALWGSFSPYNFMSICFPYSVFQGTRFYIGIFSLLFLITALCNLKKETKLRLLFIVMLTAVFLALGRYNPVYVFLLKLTKVYSLRNPSKFIFFGVFAGSILSGWGFTRFFSQKDKTNNTKALQIFLIFISSMLAIFSVVKIILLLFKDKIIQIGRWYISQYVLNKPFHRHSVETYIDKINSYYQQLINNSSLGNIFIIASLIFCIAGLIIAFYITKRISVSLHPMPLPEEERIKGEGYNFSYLKLIFFILIFIDLFIFSFYGTGFKGNIRSFNYLMPTHTKILNILKSDKDIFRILPFGLSGKNIPRWAKPNTNILVGLDSIAAYSPLVEKDYKNALMPLEVVDDALGLLSPSNEALTEKYQLLRLLNVKYIISSRKIELDFLEKVIQDNGIFLYKLKWYLPRIFFTSPHLLSSPRRGEDKTNNSSPFQGEGWGEGFTSDIDKEITQEPVKYLKIIKYDNGFAELEIEADKEGVIVFSENYFPGWKAYIDDKAVEIIKLKELIQAVRVDKGKHRIIFKFQPEFFTFSKKI